MKILKKFFVTCALVLPFLAACGQSHTHSYDPATANWVWASDYSSAKVTLTCPECKETDEGHTITLDASINEKVSKEADCENGGSKVYTATVTYGDIKVEDSKTADIDAFGHQYTSLTVEGIEDSYFALSSIDASKLTVKEVCERCKHEEIVTNFTIDYESMDDYLVYGDTKVCVSYNDLSTTVAVKVNKIEVDKPNPDTTEFVYDGNEKTYNIPSNDLYEVSGDKQSSAGTHEVTVSLKDPVNYKWKGGDSEDLSYTFTIAKAINTISGLLDSYSTYCFVGIMITDLEAKYGDVNYVIYTDASKTTEVNDKTITAGEYVIVATSESSDNYISEELTATLIVSHNFDQKITQDKFLKTSASCTEKAVYYCSCCCGEHNDETFESGEPLGHLFEGDVIVDVAATYTKEGSGHYCCQREGCSETKDVVIPKLLSDFTVDVGGAAMVNLEATPEATSGKACPDYLKVIDANTIQYSINNAIWDEDAQAADDITLRKWRMDLPKINFSLIGGVTASLKSCDFSCGPTFTSSMLFGLDQNDLRAVGDGEVTGSLTMSQFEDTKVFVKLVLGSETFEKVYDDSNIFNGLTSISIYGNAHFARGLEVSNFNFVDKCDDHDFTSFKNTGNDYISGQMIATCGTCLSSKYLTENGRGINFKTSKYGTTFDYGGAWDATPTSWDDRISWGFMNETTENELVAKLWNWNTYRWGLPKVDYTQFGTVSYNISFKYDADANGNGPMKAGLSVDTITQYANGQSEALAATGTITITRFNGYLEVNLVVGSAVNQTIKITDENVINGKTNIYTYWVSTVNDGSIMASLNSAKFSPNCKGQHMYGEYILDQDKIGYMSGHCANCGYSEKLPITEALTIDYSRNTYGACGDQCYLATVNDGDGIRGFTKGLKYATEACADYVEQHIYLPKIDFTAVNKASFLFANNSGNYYIGLGSSNYIDASGTGDDLKGVIDCIYTSDALYVTISTYSGVKTQISSKITDNAVITGASGVELFIKANVYRNLWLSPVLINDLYSTADYTRMAADYSLNFACGDLEANRWGHFDNTGVYFNSEIQATRSLTFPKVNYALTGGTRYRIEFQHGIGLSCDGENYYQVEAGDGAFCYSYVDVTLTEDAKVQVKINVYTNDTYSTIDTSLTTTFDNLDIWYGVTSLSIYAKQLYAFGRGMMVGLHSTSF